MSGKNPFLEDDENESPELQQLSSMEFRDVSIEATRSLSKDFKQKNGIFFTPSRSRRRVFELLDKHGVSPSSVLEPSFGSGEFLEDLYDHYPQARITGVELCPELYACSSRPNLHNMDFLKYEGVHDLIVGNPPYFVIAKSDDTEACQSQRPNIFVQFLYKALQRNLSDNGVLAFVLPTSIFNCVYYERMRQYLFEKTTVLELEVLSGDYIDTEQRTCLLMVRQGKTNDDYFVRIHDSLYLSPDYRALIELAKGSYSLDALGYAVKTGDVVWNQEKEKLDDDGTLLIYSSNIKDGSVVLGNLKLPKKQYIRGFHKPPVVGQSILVNRGYGNADYQLKCVLADYPEYYAENHVNVIRPRDKDACIPVDVVLRSLNSQKTKEFIRMFVGNNALSKTEIQYCLPIWLD